MAAGIAADMPRRSRPFRHLFHLFLILVLFTAATVAGARWFSSTIGAGGYTSSLEEREVVIGNSVLLVPENVIRHEHARRDGIHARLDLHLRWPELEGYTPAARDDFNHVDGRKTIVFVTIEQRHFAEDMSERLHSVYSRLLLPGTESGPAGLLFHRLDEMSGFPDDMLAVGRRAGALPFVARCQADEMAAVSLASCERDLHFGEDLSLVYRFPREMLGEWRTLDGAIMEKAAGLLQMAE